MGTRYVYFVNYRYKCEKCGKQTDWLTYKKYAETSGLSTVLRGTPGLNGIGAYLASNIDSIGTLYLKAGSAK